MEYDPPWTWTFQKVQPTLPEGGVGPWTFQKVQPTLLEGGVGLWTFQQVKSTLKMRGKPIKMPVNPLKTHNFRLLAALLEGLLDFLGGIFKQN